MDSLIGRLNHVGHIILDSRHFLSRLRHYITQLRHTPTPLDNEAAKDLLLWKDFLLDATTGISINNIVYRQTDVIFWSDASEHGLGGI
eukprot:8264918-Ditylum_brightwellii.AAC.1